MHNAGREEGEGVGYGRGENQLLLDACHEQFTERAFAPVSSAGGCVTLMIFDPVK